jgi:RsiW-degrading membrane proteinase PrsW (M82 family)
MRAAKIRYNVIMTFTQFLAALIVGLIPSLLWLFFWLHEDSAHTGPRWVLGLCFCAGMIMTLVCIPIEQWLQGFAGTESMKYTLWAATEELCKFIAVAVIALHGRWNEEPIDAMIYCIAVALGFAALENTLFVMNPMTHGGVLALSIIHGNLRSVGATLVHVVSSATIGFALGFNFYHGRIAKFCAWIAAMLAAVAIHASFNLSIVNATAGDTLKSFGWIWGAVVIMIILFEEVKAVKPHDILVNH